MTKSYLTIFIALLLLAAGGCKSSDNAEQPQPIPPPEEVTNNNKDEQPNFEQPVVEGQKLVSTVLTPPTNPDQRIKEIAKGSSIPNRNPFDVIVPSFMTSEDGSIISPIPQPNGTNVTNIIPQPNGTNATNISTSTSSSGNISTPSSNNNNSVPKKPLVSRSSLNQTPTVTRNTPSNIPVPPSPNYIKAKIPENIPIATSGKLPTGKGIPTLKPEFNPAFPPLPSPDQANGVAITGIIDINGSKHAIVKAPGEIHSRYVKTGDYLANGQVLVKDIDSNNPTIVLEQIGLDVAKEITTDGTN
jgi:hypothetical protein